MQPEQKSPFTYLPFALNDQEELSSLDLRFANFISQLADSEQEELFWAAALVSAQTRQGHVCLDLSYKAQTVITLDQQEFTLPKLENWVLTLRQCPVIGLPGETCPLILDNKNRLYLHRYWEHEAILAQKVKELASSPAPDLDWNLLIQGLERFFPNPKNLNPDWQKVAALTALTNCFCVISGGPGTGKTTTVAKILAIFLEQDPGLHIALSAPTGKAAARLEESLQRSLPLFSTQIAELMPQNASTIHRLLGVKQNSASFYHNEDNPLNFDLVVVDEASMIDLPLLSKLVRALPSQARLILLGDKDQLASVESGAAFGDICSIASPEFSSSSQKKFHDLTQDDNQLIKTEDKAKTLQDNIVHLQHTYRFDSQSGIYSATKAIQKNNIPGVLSSLQDQKFPDTQWIDLDTPSRLKNVLQDLFLPYAQKLLNASSAEQAFFELNRLRLLTPLRQGPFGSWTLNNLLEKILQRKGLIPPRQTFYSGRPLMVLQNDYYRGLFNGDVGLVRRSQSSPEVVFPSAQGNYRFFTPQRLPQHETVFAMTVHKSQGSEFDNVLLVLPDRDNAVLTRELIYTALTRAKNKVSILGRVDILEKALKRKVQRFSGLQDALSELNCCNP
jgi:exodeoxyribonuclease V alpha subunit